MKPKKMKIILTLFAFLFFSTSIFASDIAMIIESLTVDLNITEDNQYQIKETYENNFIKQSHGFFREVATDYTSCDFYTIVKDAYCSAKMSEEVGTYSTIYKIGDADKYVNGKKDYIFGYTLDVGKNYHAETDGYDFIKYTLIQSSSYPIEKANFKITLPKEINLSDIHFASGKHGDTGFAGTFSLLEDNKTIIGSIENLDTQQNVTVGIELPVDYFEGQRDFFAILDIKFIISLIILIASIVFAFLLFSKYGRDEDIIEVQSFDVPNGFNPMQLAHFINRDVSIKDTTSMLFYWADRGYLKIIEEEPDKKGKSEYIIRKLKKLPSGLDISERKMFEAYFHNVDIDEEITLTDLDEKFIARRQKAIEKVPEYFVSKNNTELVEPKSKKAKNKILALAAVTFFIFTILALPTLPILTKLITSIVSLIFNIIIYIFISIFFSRIINLASTKKTSKKVRNLFISILIFLGMLIINIVILIIICNFKFAQTTLLIKFALIPTVSFYVLAILSALTEKRSEYATQTFGKILGYKSFIEFVEIDKLKMMIEEDPMLFYHTLSFAIVFDLEKKWYKKFETIEIPQSNYFGFYMVGAMGSRSMFNGIDNFNHTVIDHTVATAVRVSGSGSSSSGGGGFSTSAGGGFGGGGSNGTW